MTKLQLPFNSLPLFQIARSGITRYEDDSGNFVLWSKGVTYWHDFHVLAVLLHHAQQTGSSRIEVMKTWILHELGQTRQGKNYRKLNESLRKWSGLLISKDNIDYSILSYEDSKSSLMIDFNISYFRKAKECGKLYSLAKIFKSKAIEFRIFQIIAPLMHFNKILKLDPAKIANKMILGAKSIAEVKKRVGARIAAAIEKLCEDGWIVNQAWEWSKGKRWWYLYKEELIGELYNKQKEGSWKAIETAPAPHKTKKAQENCANNLPKSFNHNNFSVRKQEKPISFEEKYSLASTKMQEVVADFDPSFLRKPEHRKRFVDNHEFLIKVAKFKLSAKSGNLNGRTIFGWIQDGCPRSRFKDYLDHEANQALKEKAKDVGYIDSAKDILYKKVAEILRLQGQGEKEQAWRDVCKNYLVGADMYLVRKDFLHLFVNKALDDQLMEGYKNSVYLDMINSLFGNDFLKRIPLSWYPYSTVIKEEKAGTGSVSAAGAGGARYYRTLSREEFEARKVAKAQYLLENAVV